jgi:endonuclease/exonuclease/phosphatase family metal-dependent hydrolase
VECVLLRDGLMRIASFNVESLFQRAHAMNLAKQSDGKAALTKHAQLNAILAKTVYTAADKAKIVTLMKELGIDKKDDGGEFVLLRQNRAHLVKRPSGGGLQVVAGGRGDWIGWVDLKMEAVNEVATRMTAKVIHEVGADIVALVEAESRPSLVKFHDDVLELTHGDSYDHVMLIDGNDDRGIDVAIMSRNGYALDSIRSHVDDRTNGSRVFSRDCAEYHFKTPGNDRLVVLVNHFKSKGFGSQVANDERRRLQAQRAKAIYEDLRAGGASNIAVVGDFNDTPDSDPLKPLIQGTDLKDISEQSAFDDQGRPGTFGNGTQSNKIDYILLSPALFAKATGGSIFRKGVWGGTNGTLFPHFAEITKAAESASDHAAIVADVDLA